MNETTRDLDRLRALTRVMDEALRVPGTRFRVGLDGILGFVPGVGDAVTAAISGYALLAAARAGAPRSLLARMTGNILLDALVGAVPVLGDLFDFAFKANRKNLRLLEGHLQAPARTRTESRGVVGAIIAVLALALVGGIALAVWLAGALWSLLT